ncbi:site-2 protease family protein [Helicobacter trogontum]|uniref:Peptidase M50 n=1 Tax=Helicobacter trogontum TaxID=50960 RepID=A0A099VJA8_9HELI|nr:site-2 protease family protein [Helicobacter trogontum]MCI5787313.1 site-2 protease family protein [Helicobacter trogontum]MDY5186030.1 site-2 protease family protein [Helicobacter trogontum]TLD83630.1 site-2 protease family protein [Helicobacter trogontum]TLD98362.1 site-2 protease family protein [Helicobacter trogontum]
MDDLDIAEVVVTISCYIVALLFSAVGREILSGLMALRYGDETPRESNRVTLNPLKHVDILGTFVIPLTLIILGANFIFGYAKPMPINYENIRERTGYKGCLYVALSGTFFNFLIALCCVVILRFGIELNLMQNGDFTVQFFFILLQVNIMLAIFNLLPIPPLNGALILAYIGLYFQNSFFARLYNNVEKYGMILIIIILLFPPTNEAILLVMKNTLLFFLKL